MSASKLIAAAALAVLGLTACDNPDRRSQTAAGSRLCTPFPEAATASAAAPGLQPSGDPAAVVEDCLHRWAYSLAPAADKADLVAQATLAACAPALSRWNQQSLATTAPGAPAAGGAPPAPSLMTGQPTTPFQEHYSYGQARALFYVVQARAGKCPPPPPTAPANAPPSAR